MQKNKYFVISLITAGIASAVSAYMMIAKPIRLELALNWIQLGCLFPALYCTIACAGKDKTNLFCQFQVGAVSCFALGQIYWVLHLLIIGYDERTFSISDLSWIGFYLFLFSAVFGFINPIIKDKKKELRKYRAAALLAPAAFIAAGTVQLLGVIQNGFGDIFYVAVYTTVMAPLSYYAFKLSILPAKIDLRLKAMRPYNILILAIMTVDTAWTFSDLANHGSLFCLCEFLLCILLLSITPAAYGGIREWTTC